MNKSKQNNQEKTDLHHPLAHVVMGDDILLIEGRKYEILANEKNALDIEVLREKYDPFLNQYDYIVGDVSSEHLRLKGFYDSKEHVAIDKKAITIVDYLEEYCNPGSAYFILHLLDDNQAKRVALGRRNKKRRQNKRNQNKRRRFKNNNFTERKVRKTKIKPRHTVAIKSKSRTQKNRSFVIKKRKG